MPRHAFLGLLAVALLAPGVSFGDDDIPGQVVFTRGGSLWQTNPKGKGDAQELVTLPEGVSVRALRVDAHGRVLLANLDGTWHQLAPIVPGSPLRSLPCVGEAHITDDAAAVTCSDPAGNTLIVDLATGTPSPRAVPAAGALLVGRSAGKQLIWADPGGVWAAPVADLMKKIPLAPQAPRRHFSVSPDGTRAFGVYSATIRSGKSQADADVLFGFALDGTAARRKAIRDGVPLAWSFDSRWVLVQNQNAACIMRAVGGQYKCWRGYTAASISPDGQFALVLGKRRGEAPPTRSRNGKGQKKPPAPAPATGAAAEGEGGEGGETIEEAAGIVAPSGPLSLYRAALAGAFTAAPALVETVVDGPAIWIPEESPAASAAPSQ
jgi:hypothetical protein